MRIAYTSDIHVDSSEQNCEIPALIRERLKEQPADVLIIAGDVACRTEDMDEALAQMKDLDMPKMLIPGNHDVWVEEGSNSYRKYFEILPEIARRNGFIPLWTEPTVVDGVGFIGGMGWYDLSLRNYDTKFTEEDYARKEYGMFVWMDRVRADFTSNGHKPDDMELTGNFYRLYTEHYEQIASRSEKVVSVFHHLPFRELINYEGRPGWDYFVAFMGSERFGAFMREREKCVLSISGHLHKIKDVQVGHVRALASPFGYFKETPLGQEEWFRAHFGTVEI